MAIELAQQRRLGGAHGRTSCVLLPAVLRWRATVNRERQRAPAYPPVPANPRPIHGVDDRREILALAW